LKKASEEARPEVKRRNKRRMPGANNKRELNNIRLDLKRMDNWGATSSDALLETKGKPGND